MFIKPKMQGNAVPSQEKDCSEGFRAVSQNLRVWNRVRAEVHAISIEYGSADVPCSIPPHSTVNIKLIREPLVVDIGVPLVILFTFGIVPNESSMRNSSPLNYVGHIERSS